MNGMTGVGAIVTVLVVCILGLALVLGCRPVGPTPITPKAVLSGPGVVEYDKPVEFSAEGTVGNVEWLVLPKVDVEFSSMKCHFTPSQDVREYYVVLVAYGGDRVDVTSKSVSVTKPTPPEPPGPPLPVGDLAKKAAEAKMRLVPVNSLTKSGKIADVYDGLRPIEFRDIKQAREKTREKIRTAIGIKEWEAWAPWFGEMGKLLDMMNIDSARDWCSACQELARGLRQ